ncbi:MAG TPA: DUF998 domain-containing protein [Catenuloplanes sp.]
MADLAAVAGRASAAAAGALVIGGTLAVAAAVAAGPGTGLAGYVSEAGTSTYPLAGTYRAGVLAIAAGLAVLGGAAAPLSALGAALLGVAAVAAAVSGAVPCTDRCPLPPFEAATGADLVHGGASIVGVAACVFAMLALAATPAARATPAVGPAVRRLALVGAGVTLPLSGAMGLAMLFAGRGTVTGAVERALLLAAATWVVATATLLVRAGGSPATRTTLEHAQPTASTWRNDR